MKNIVSFVFILTLMSTLTTTGYTMPPCQQNHNTSSPTVNVRPVHLQHNHTAAIEELRALYPHARIYNLILSSGNGSALNAATCGTIQRNTSMFQDGSEILVNGKFPGPILYSQKNQLLIVRVVNEMKENTISLHWHGIVQAKTPFMDGTSMVSQCPIHPRGREFVYIMNTTDVGTFLYHGHIRLSPVNLYGMLIVQEPKGGDNNQLPNWPGLVSSMEEDIPLLLSDAWQNKSIDQLNGLREKEFQWIGNPQAILINGKASSCLPRLALGRTQSQTKKSSPLIRIVNAATLGFLSLEVEDHHFIVLRADLSLVQPFTTKALEINSGQRYDVILVRDKDVAIYGEEQKEFWLHVKMIGRSNGTEAWGIVTYDNVANTNGPTLYDSTRSLQDLIELQQQPYQEEVFGGMEAQLKSYQEKHPRHSAILPEASFEYIVHTEQKKTSEGFMQWSMNGLARSPTLDYPLLWYAKQMEKQIQIHGKTLEEVKKWLELQIPDEAHRPLVIQQHQVVQIVLQNTVALNGICEQHPFHLHLGEFVVLAYGKGTYEPLSIDLQAKNTTTGNFLWRDTITMPPSNHSYTQVQGNPGEGCGWVVLRVVFDNPGASLFHCHIAAHMSMGMAVYMIILPSENETITTPPDIRSTHGLTTNLVRHCASYLQDVEDGIDG
jgi:L-ascorbate oxidase